MPCHAMPFLIKATNWPVNYLLINSSNSFCLQACIFVGVFIMIASTIGGFRNIVTDSSTYRFYTWIMAKCIWTSLQDLFFLLISCLAAMPLLWDNRHYKVHQLLISIPVFQKNSIKYFFCSVIFIAPFFLWCVLYLSIYYIKIKKSKIILVKKVPSRNEKVKLQFSSMG